MIFNRWPAAGAVLLAVLCWSGLVTGVARADEQIGVGPTPVLNVQLTSGELTVNTWDRPDVSVSSAGTVQVQHLDASEVDPRMPRQVPVLSQSVAGPDGDILLRAEPFVLPQLEGQHHDEILAHGAGNTTIMIPRGTALVIAHVDQGRVNLSNYRGAFVTQVHRGGVYLNRVDGSGFVQTLHGPVVANDSTFERLRVRTATGNMEFHGCTSHQIEATSHYGSITYDNGSFQPGLARFESQHGNIALGVRGGAQVGAYAGSGRILSNFQDGSSVRAGGPNSAQANVRGGGPVVTATTQNGAVYLYNDSIGDHPQLQAEMRGRGTQARAEAPARGLPSYRPVSHAPVYRQPVPRYPTPRYQPPVRYQGPPVRYQPPPRYQGPPPGYRQQQQPPAGYPQGQHKRRHEQQQQPPH